jgi:hypothetical protein
MHIFDDSPERPPPIFDPVFTDRDGIPPLAIYLLKREYVEGVPENSTGLNDVERVTPSGPLAGAVCTCTWQSLRWRVRVE